VLILEKEDFVGGPWGKSRIYPGFWSQSGIRMSGFSDVPLTVPQNAEVFNDIFEAKYVTKYLENYLDDHIYAETPLRERVVTGFAVSEVDKVRGIWTVQGAPVADSVQQSFKTKRIIVATGMTSAPRMPMFVGQEQFGGPILHQKHYGQFLSEQSSDHRKVAVLGAGKSAADVVYGLVRAGNEVHWIIRKSGRAQVHSRIRRRTRRALF
jgi:dimethylaniline monooxygenase (N-oxide forming)